VWCVDVESIILGFKIYIHDLIDRNLTVSSCKFKVIVNLHRHGVTFRETNLIMINENLGDI
jgi:hypothetical protein